MTWGPFWLFYQCPACGKKFRHDLDMPDERFRKCPACDTLGELKGDSNQVPTDINEYEFA